MCTKPLTINGFQVSCRECDQCVATYKNSWVARCVAEKQAMPYAYAITLTYADVHGEPPLGARVYRYRDVAAFWKRIRDAGFARWKKRISLRYVIVGEKGTRFGRCHYHGVIFSSHPIVELGKFTSAKGDGFTYKRRLNWSTWGHGFVEFQRADRKGISYALKYILKSRMTAARSEGFGREGKTEWLASSYLWCSKKPAIGETWLWPKLYDLAEKGVCPSSLRVRVPGGGDWYVAGKLQKEVCLFLHETNKQFQAERGRSLAGWASLISSCQAEIENSETGEILNRKSWEWLTHGEEEEKNTVQKNPEREFVAFKEWLEHKRRVAAPIEDARATLRNCGNVAPCEACRAKLSPEQIADLVQEYLFRFSEWQERHAQGEKEADSDYQKRFDRWWLTRLRPARGCRLRGTGLLKLQFDKLLPIIKAEHGLTHKSAIGKALRPETG